MDTIRVNTSALRDLRAGYQSVSNSLQSDINAIQNAEQALLTMHGFHTEAGQLRQAIQLAETAAAEARELGRKCEMIADVYEATERKVSALVDALPTTVQVLGQVSPAIRAPAFAPSLARVDSPVKPVEPVFLCSNRLPCESWLFNRAIKASFEEGEVSNEEGEVSY